MNLHNDDEPPLSLRFCGEDTDAILDGEMIRRYLEKLDGWGSDGKSLHKTYIFHSFKESLAFSNTVGNISQILDYYPSISFNAKVVAVMTDWEGKNGITLCDFILASKVEAAYDLMHKQIR